ncbi:MAG: septum formation initiator family protein [bacterium]|nr:septum formation initiator family protein [bacterium]
MSRKLPFKEKKVVQGLLVLLTLVVVLLSLIGDKGVVQLSRIQEQESQLKTELEALRREKLEWAGKLASLRHNSTYLETLARERLGMIAKDEFILLAPQEALPPLAQVLGEATSDAAQ